MQFRINVHESANDFPVGDMGTIPRYQIIHFISDSISNMKQVCLGRVCQTQTFVVDTNEVSNFVIDRYHRQSVNDTESARSYIWITRPNFR